MFQKFSVMSRMTSQKKLIYITWTQIWSVRSDRLQSETGVTGTTFVTGLQIFSSEMPSPTQEKRKQEACEHARPEDQAEDGDILRSNTTCYQILDFNGEGSFGQVVKCLDLNTSQIVAIKIHKDNKDSLIEREVAMLEAVSVLDLEKQNIVRFIDSFTYQHHSCLAFEMLDMSLWDLIKKREWEPLSLNEIRTVTHQLLVAFEALKSIGIMHTDLKPDNVMLVNHKDQPFKVKLIDFGLAIHTSEVKVGMMMQANSYRAPEVNLGLPLSESVDMWALGCVMAFLYFGANLFPGNCPYHWMKTVVHMVGQPENHHLIAAQFSWAYFFWDEFTGWRLRTPEEYEAVTGVKTDVYERALDSAWNLQDAVMNYTPTEDHHEFEDRRAFLDLLRCCLYLDHEVRITPREALEHSFITMDHLRAEMAASSYTDTALQLLSVSLQDTSDDDKGHEDYSNSAVITDLQKDPYWYQGKELLNSSSYDADVEDFSAETKESQSESDTVSNSNRCRGSNSYSNKCLSCGYDADIDSFSDDPDTRHSHFRRPARKCLLRRRQPLKRCCDHLNNNADTKTTLQPATSHSYHQDPSPSNPTNGVNIQSNKPPGPSAETSLRDGVAFTPPKKEPDTSAPHNHDNTSVDRVPVAIENDADVAPTDGATVFVPSTNGATADIQIVDTDTVNTGPRRNNAFQRVNKFFSSVKKRMVSIFSLRKKRSNPRTQ
ncbi:homeodomain-interacting protein kinase 3-like [Echeneis naucrates]|uniref:homeodomain-interacting protein kinase 3-like n=1 Tax=Echeneis naucrates TaxID=173247 RepID=UPI0011133CD8|nr:homeodomain-interacting protein kinase 3-like [Echeneis naucrates]